MELAFGIYKYFPYSGLALDMLRIAKESVKRGHRVTIFTRDWQGDKPVGIDVVLLTVSGLSNHAKADSFNQQFIQRVNKGDFDLSVGFNKIPGVDYYFCGDFCYLEHSLNKNTILYRWTARYRAFRAFEQAIFGVQSNTTILSLSPHEDTIFKKHYGTPEQRFVSLPPMLEKARWIDNQDLPSRTQIRNELGVKDEQSLILFVGSDFVRKGLDRVLLAVASLDKELQEKVVLCVAGKNKLTKYQRMIKKLGIAEQVQLLGPRNDVPALMKAGDIFTHPARAELAGGVIVEAIVSGLSVIVTPVCGYAWHVKEADAGIVLSGEFSQDELNRSLHQVLTSGERARWRENGMNYARSQNLYAMAETAVDAFEAHAANQIASQSLTPKNERTHFDWYKDLSCEFSSWGKFARWNKTQQNELAAFIKVSNSQVNGKQYLDRMITDSANIIKHDRTTTVATSVAGSQDCIIKRYNARDGYHKLSRAVRKSRAQRCWVMSYVFCDAGLNVARPIFMFEQRFGPLRFDAYFVSQALHGEELLSALPKMSNSQKQQVVAAINDAFDKMFKAKISHGDLKATNLIWADDKLFFIDLDGSKQHLTDESTRRANAKDVKRFLRNWHDQPELLSLFDELD